MIPMFKRPILAGLLMNVMMVSATFGMDLLSRTAQKGDAATVRSLLNAGSSPKMQDLFGWTSLHSAALRGSGEIVKMLLEADADPNRQLRNRVYGDYCVACGLEPDFGDFPGLACEVGSTPLHIAAACGHLEAVQVLLDAGARHDLCDADGVTPLHMAAERSLLSDLRYMSDVRAAHDLVAQRSFSEIVRMLLDVGACPDIQKAGFFTPLHAAAQGRHADAVRILLDAGYACDCQESDGGATPLYAAAFSGCIEGVQMLLAAGADPNLSIDSDAMATHGGGAVPLHVAVDHNSVEMVQALLDAGAHVNAQNVLGMTPLFTAIIVARGRESIRDIVNILLERGADPNLSTNTNCSGGFGDSFPSYFTPLSICRDEQMAHRLLSAGANPYAEGQDGYTPLHHAAMLGEKGCDIRLLLKVGANLAARNHKGETPLQAVVAMSDEDLVRWDHTPEFLPIEFGSKRRQAVRDLLQAGSPMD